MLLGFLNEHQIVSKTLLSSITPISEKKKLLLSINSNYCYFSVIYNDFYVTNYFGHSSVKVNYLLLKYFKNNFFENNKF